MTFITSHVGATSITTGDTLVLVAGASITSNAGALSFGGNDVRAWLAGTVWGGSFGITGQSASASGLAAEITVAVGGLVHGQQAGISLVGVDVDLVNLGTVSGENGLFLGAAADDRLVGLHNRGLILGETQAIFRDYDANHYCDITIRNRGVIQGDTGAFLSLDDDSFESITNWGEIIGGISMGGGQDGLVNRGHIEGPIYMGADNDAVDFRQSEDAESVIDLGDGDDLATLGGPGVEVILGQGGADTVSYRSSRGVTVNLADVTLNRGAAAGDEYYDVENVTGSLVGNDRLTGNTANNRLEGLGGADRLAGGGGRDTLSGGAGLDTLTGGLGNDVFLFAEEALSGDEVSDFTKVNGNRDSIAFQRDGFSANLNEGVLEAAYFVARADNAAQDADDYFIFRTTDQTLWYDRDGSGVIFAAVLVADFAAGVTLVAADIDIL